MSSSSTGSRHSSPQSGPFSKRRKTVMAFIQAYNDWSIPSILSIRSRDCTHEFLPRSLNRPIMDNETYVAYMSVTIPHYHNFKLEINDIIEDERANKAMVWASSHADTEIGPFSNELMFVIYLSDKGDKVQKVLEFVDSATVVAHLGELRRYIAEKGGTSTTMEISRQEL